MRFLNFLVLVARTFALVLPSKIPQHALTSPSQCTFHHPNSHAILPSSRIPSHAWPHLVALLLSHPMHTTLLSSTGRSSTMQTIDLASAANDEHFSGIKLGLVYAGYGPTPMPIAKSHPEETQAAKEEMKRSVSSNSEIDCLDSAIRELGEKKQMEGVFEFGRGRVSYLLYRVD